MGLSASQVGLLVAATSPSRSRGRAAAFVISAFTAGSALAAVISAQLLRTDG